MSHHPVETRLREVVENCSVQVQQKIAASQHTLFKSSRFFVSPCTCSQSRTGTANYLLWESLKSRLYYENKISSAKYVQNCKTIAANLKLTLLKMRHNGKSVTFLTMNNEIYKLRCKIRSYTILCSDNHVTQWSNKWRTEKRKCSS